MAMAACLPFGVEVITQGRLASVSRAQEPEPSSSTMSMETWMNEWMSVSKAPGGLLKLSRFREPIYFLIAPISWKPNPGQEEYAGVSVPTGFVTDLTSIPSIFFSLLRPDGPYAYAAVVHDYLYWTQTRSREEADKILNLAMQDFEINEITVNAIYWTVRALGQLAWKSNAKKKTQGEKRLLTRFPQDPRTRWEDWKQRPGVFTS